MSGSGRPRTLVLSAVLSAALLTTATAGVGLVLDPDPLGVVVLLALLAAQAVALLRRLPGAPPRTGRALAAPIVLAAVTLLSIPLLAPLGVERGWETWAWVGAGLVGSVPLLVGRWTGVAICAVLVAASAGVGRWVGGSPGVYALLTAGTGLALLLIHLVPLRLGRLVGEAQAGRGAAARLAAAEERLRLAADVHDVLGHQLTVIALAAELAARTAHTDPDTAAGHAERARASAATALAQMRRVVHGYREPDLPAQLDAVAQVLRASGIRASVEMHGAARSIDGQSGPPGDATLAAVAREAGTNVLRHSRARWCTIVLVHTAAETRLTIVNDAASDGAAGPGADRYSSGLSGLRDRLTAAGGTLHTGLDDGVFTLRATVPA